MVLVGLLPIEIGGGAAESKDKIVAVSGISSS